jgi:hypothetical protein
MQDYAKLYRRRFEDRIAVRKMRQIRRLIKMQIPVDILMFLIVAVVFPAQLTQFIRK